jgi:hypothetical protein
MKILFELFDFQVKRIMDFRNVYNYAPVHTA